MSVASDCDGTCYLAVPLLISGVFKSLWAQLFIIGMNAFIYFFCYECFCDWFEIVNNLLFNIPFCTFISRRMMT